MVAVKFLKRFFQIDLAIPVHEFFKQAGKQEGERKVSIYSCKSTCTSHLYQSPVPVTCTKSPVPSHRLTFPNGFLHLRRDRRQQRRVTAVFDVPGFRAFLFHPKGFLAVPQKDVLARPTRFVQIVLGFRQFKPEKRWKMHFVVCQPCFSRRHRNVQHWGYIFRVFSDPDVRMPPREKFATGDTFVDAREA